MGGSGPGQLLLTRGAVGGEGSILPADLALLLPALSFSHSKLGTGQGHLLSIRSLMGEWHGPSQLTESPFPKSCRTPLRGPPGGQAPGQPFLPLTNRQPLVSPQNAATG